LLLATFEEVGWMGYGFPRMMMMQQVGGGKRPTATTWTKTALRLGLIWAAWHLPFFLFLFPDTVVPQVLLLLATRMIMVWIYSEQTKESVLSSILYHASDNTALLLFPDFTGGTPHGAAIHCAVVTAVAAAIALSTSVTTSTIHPLSDKKQRLR
jgi:membrane protease YdiL (CAAX protease family)